MVRGYMIGYKIKDKTNAPLREFFPGDGQSRKSTEVVVDSISPHAVRRAHDILGSKIRKDLPEFRHESSIVECNLNPDRTPFPDTHEPYGINTKGGQEVPFLWRHY
jgi:hypothetical protein